MRNFYSDGMFAIVFYFGKQVNETLIEMARKFCVEPKISSRNKPYTILLMGKLNGVISSEVINALFDELPYNYITDFSDGIIGVLEEEIDRMRQVALFINSEKTKLDIFIKILKAGVTPFTRDVFITDDGFIYLGVLYI